MNNKKKIEYLRFALNIFAQLFLIVPALFLVVYKPFKRKGVIGDIFDAKRAVRNHLEKVPSSHVTTYDKFVTTHDKSRHQEKFKLVRFHDQGTVVMLIMKLTGTFKIGRHD